MEVIDSKIEHKYKTILSLIEGLSDRDINSNKNFRNLSNDINVWALSLDEIKDEMDFKKIISKSELKVNIGNDFNAYFILKKLNLNERLALNLKGVKL
jgi:hypothetical protein